MVRGLGPTEYKDVGTSYSCTHTRELPSDFVTDYSQCAVVLGAVKDRASGALTRQSLTAPARAGLLIRMGSGRGNGFPKIEQGNSESMQR
jgi:hypothetical protein